jgi:hypothetical protein
MNKEELEKLKSTVKQWLFHTGSLDPTNYANELKLKFIDPREKRIAELEAQIEKMKCCGNCTKGNCVNIGQKGKACTYWTSNELRR